MDKITKLIHAWADSTTSVRVRDRTVKIMQYGIQMMLGFYGDQMNKEWKDTLKIAKRTASTSRRAFWLLKSFNHISSVIKMLPTLLTDFSLLNVLDTIEQLSLIVYYYYENLVYFIRASLIKSFTEDDIDYHVNWSSLVGSIASFTAASIRLCFTLWHNYALNQCNIDEQAIIKYKPLRTDVISFLIEFFELVASIEFCHLWRKIIGHDIGDGYCGLCGVASSALTLLDAHVKNWPKN